MNVLFESFGAFIAAYLGFMNYKHLNSFYRILFVQLATWLTLYAISYLVTTYQAYHTLPTNNHWVFNLNILVETIFLLYAVGNYFEDATVKKTLKVCGVLFFCGAIIIHITGDFFRFNVPVYIAESILLTLIYTGLLFRCFYETFKEETYRPEILASIGIVLYFGCNLPYFSLFNFLNTHYSAISETFQDYITDVLSNIRYLFLAAGFWLVGKRTTISL